MRSPIILKIVDVVLSPSDRSDAMVRMEARPRRTKGRLRPLRNVYAQDALFPLEVTYLVRDTMFPIVLENLDGRKPKFRMYNNVPPML